MNIAVLLFHDVHELDVVGPYSVINAARAFLDDPEALSLQTIAKSRNSVQTSGGMVITPHWAFASALQPELLIVPGGKGVVAASRDKAVVGYVREQVERVRFLASVSTGSLLLGKLGLLRDLTATTSPEMLEQLRDYEVGEISRERVVKNAWHGGGLWCAGGSTAGIDLGLELLTELYDPELAKKTAAQLDYPFRPVTAE